MITCPKCKRIVKHINTITNGFDEIVTVNAFCKRHGIVNADYDDYEEVVPRETIENKEA